MRHAKYPLLAAFAFFAAVLGVLGETSPKLEFDRQTFDFGSLERVRQVTGSFTYRNVGDADLQIKVRSVTCVCARAAASPATVAPGQSGSVEFAINIGPSVGDMTEQITISSNDPHIPSTTLLVKVHVKPIFLVSPDRILFDDLPRGAEQRASVLVDRTDGKPLNITKIVSTSPSISTEVEPVPGSNATSARIIIHYKAGEKLGTYTDTLYVHTGEEYFEGIPKSSCDIFIKAVVTSRPR